jgi:hypothetical protein
VPSSTKATNSAIVTAWRSLATAGRLRAQTPPRRLIPSSVQNAFDLVRWGKPGVSNGPDRAGVTGPQRWGTVVRVPAPQHRRRAETGAGASRVT